MDQTSDRQMLLGTCLAVLLPLPVRPVLGPGHAGVGKVLIRTTLSGSTGAVRTTSPWS